MIPVRRGPLIAVWLFALALLMLLIGSVLIYNGLHAVGHSPVNVVIDGEEVITGLNLASMPPAHKVVLAFGLAFALLAALLIVPVALVMCVVAALIAALFVIGIPVAVVLLVLSIALSPIIAIAWVAWWALRRKSVPSATVAG